jgi:RNA polymerase sigma-70 factor (ECF subfamily)
MGTGARETAERVARAAYGRLLAHLAARSRDLAAAEDALAEAFRAALETWPERGIPGRPEAWLFTAARRHLVHLGRRSAVRAAAEPTLMLLAEERQEREPAVFPDERLKLLFVCAHPAIDPAARAPLMLQTVLGLDASRIASAFLTAPAAIGQRLVRAKRKIRDAGIAFAIPDPAELADRLQVVLDAIYAAYGSGWEDVAGADARRKGLAEEAIWLARLVVSLLPGEPEARGLLALMLYCESRSTARRSPAGAFVPLSEQDPALWSRAMIVEAERELAVAGTGGRPGRYQLEAAIQSVHVQRGVTGRTNWEAVALLYDGLVALAPTVGALVGRAAAHGEASGAAAGLTALDGIEPDAVRAYQPYWAARAHLLARAGDSGAAKAYATAIGLAEDPAVRAFLLARAAASQ